jgi:hypothetical protein
MATKTRLLSYDPDTKTSIYLEDYGPGEGFGFRTQQDVTDILEANKEAQTYGNHYKHKTKEGEWWHAAHIPNCVGVDILDKTGINIYSDDPEHLKAFNKLLNSSDYRWLRSSEFTI